MTKEDIRDWTPQMIGMKILELESEYDQLLKKKSEIVNDLALLHNYYDNIKRYKGSTEIQELIRCKDCMNYVESIFGDGMFCGCDGAMRDPDWYCADGERKA